MACADATEFNTNKPTVITVHADMDKTMYRPIFLRLLSTGKEKQKQVQVLFLFTSNFRNWSWLLSMERLTIGSVSGICSQQVLQAIRRSLMLRGFSI